MHQELWGYKAKEKLHLGVCEQKRLNTTAIVQVFAGIPAALCFSPVPPGK
jgi:hypothetical protein